MSQSGVLVTAASIGAVITLTGDAGGAISPVLGNINVLGGSNISTSGAGNTITYNLSGTTDHGVQTGNAGGSLTSLAVGTDGQILVGATAADAAFATLTSSDGSITFTPGANTLDLQASDPTTFNADVGSATPAADILIVTGGNNIATSGAGNTLTIDVDGTTNNALQMGNASGSLTSLAVGTDGQVLIGATAAASAFATLTSVDASIVFTPGANTLDLSAGGMFADTFTTDSGNAIPAAGILNVLGGDNLNTTGAGNTVTAHLNETIHWPDTNAAGTTGVIFLGGAGGVGGDRFMHNYGTFNTFLGKDAGNFSLTPALPGGAFSNTGIGVGSLTSLTTSNGNVAVGINTLGQLFSGEGNNVAIGSRAGQLLTTGRINDFIGARTGTDTLSPGPFDGLLTGIANIIIGSGDASILAAAGSQYTGAESSNILLRNIGVTGEDNTIHIGTTGAGTGQQSRCFVAGINGITPAAVGSSTICDTAGQLGTITQTNGEVIIGSTGATPVAAALTAGTGIEVTNGVGSITVGIDADTEMTAIHGWNGAIIETPAVTVTAAGGVITFSVEQSGGGNLTVVFSDGFYDWTTAPDTIALTAGSDTSPQINYVYFLQSTKALTVSTSDFPVAEHAPLATVLCQSAASLQTDGAYKVHAWTDHIVDTTEQGHISNINHWIRHQHATWSSGVTPTLTITPNGGSADNVIFTSTSGVALQLHDHTFPAFAGTPDVYTVNDFTTNYNVVTDLNALLTDSTNVSMSGKYFSLVIWGVVSESTGDCKLMVNLPGGSYNNQNALLIDASKFADFSIPTDFVGTGFLISQLNLRHQVAASGTWTEISIVNLRGLVPSLAAGGATAAQTEFEDNTFRILDDGDNTKELAFEVSGITTATTRTLTVQDEDGTIELTNIWTEIVAVGPTAMTVSNGYIANNVALVTLTLPATAAVGEYVRVSNKGAGFVTIAQNAGQTIHFGTSDSTPGVGGDITATALYDAVELVCITANTDFSVVSSIGNWVIT